MEKTKLENKFKKSTMLIEISNQFTEEKTLTGVF